MRFLLIALLSLGLFFRFANLDHKVYWYDETFTSLRAAGYTEAEIVQRFAKSAVVSAAELQQYQQPAPHKTLADTLHSLAAEDNQHPPLYYGIAHVWSRFAGSSVAAMRFLPAVFSLLSLPCVYWLCQELLVQTGQFHTRLPAWLAVALWAVSPFQVIYGQESRQYSLWATTTLLLTAMLLRAIRLGSAANWIGYGLALAVNLYTFPLSGLVALAHGVYVLFQGNWLQAGKSPQRLNWNWRHPWVCYVLASLFGIALFLPWVWVLGRNLTQAQMVTSWISNQQTLLQLILTWASVVGRVFYDRGETVADRVVQIGILLLVAHAFYNLCRHTPRRVWLLVVTLTVIPVLPLMLADLLLGGIRSTFPRFFIPSLLGIQLAVVYLLSRKLSHPLHQHRWRWIVAAVYCMGVLACGTSLQASTWWQKVHNQEIPAVAAIVNQASRPLLISDAETGDLLALSHWLQPDVKLLLRPRCYTCSAVVSETLDASLFPVPVGYSEVFLFHPRGSKVWQQSLTQHPKYRFVPISLVTETAAQQNNNKVLYRIVNK
jgi:uncharacterized membrane protein